MQPIFIAWRTEQNKVALRVHGDGDSLAGGSRRPAGVLMVELCISGAISGHFSQLRSKYLPKERGLGPPPCRCQAPWSLMALSPWGETGTAGWSWVSINRGQTAVCEAGVLLCLACEDLF